MSIKSLFSSRQHARRQARTRRNGRRFQDIIDKAFVSAKVQKADADALARTQSEAINITNAIWLTEDALRKLHNELNTIPDENHDTVDLDPELDIDRFELKGLPTLKLKSWRKLPEQVKCRIWCGCVWAANGFKLNDAWTKAEKSLVNTIGKLVIVRKVCDSKRFERIGGCVVRQLNGRGKDDTYLCLKEFFSMILSIARKSKGHNMLKSTIDNVPDALVKLVPVVQLAATAGCSHTRQEKTDALRAAATVLGAEEYVNSCYSDPKSSPTTRKIARQIISSIHPEPLDWGLVIDIPWGRPSMRSLAVELAENTLSDTLRGKEISRNETLLTRCVGFGRLLRNAQENLVEFGSKGQRLQRCIAQVEDAWRNKDFSAHIDYDFGDMLDDKQGVFDFYE